MTRAHNVRRSKARTTLRQSRVMARTEFDKAIDEGLEGYRSF
jgi:hypothetical protein